MDKGTDRLTDRKMNECIEGWSNIGTEGQINREICGNMDGWIVVLRDRWKEGWME